MRRTPACCRRAASPVLAIHAGLPTFRRLLPVPPTPVGSRVAQGLRADGKAEVFAPYIEGCFQLLVLVSRVTEQHGSTDDLLRAAVGVVGDLSSTLGPRFKQHVRQSPYKEAVKLLMKEANKSPSDQTKQVASWANGVTFH